MVIIGVDPSLQKTGVSVKRDGEPLKMFLIDKRKRDKKQKDIDPGRMVAIAEEIAKLADTCEPVILCIEEHGGQTGYASGNIALHWLIRVELAKTCNSRALLVAPATLKKFVTGNGRAEKGEIGAHIIKRWGEEIGDNLLQEDALESFALLKFAQCWLDTKSDCGYAYSWADFQVNIAKFQRAGVLRELKPDTFTLGNMG